jgi:hypothetical protein
VTRKSQRFYVAGILHRIANAILPRGVTFWIHLLACTLGNPNQKSRGCRKIRPVSDPIGRNHGAPLQARFEAMESDPIGSPLGVALAKLGRGVNGLPARGAQP